MNALLDVRLLSVAYGGLFANDSINLEVEAGEIVGLIGPNGAGKTTFIDALTGFTPSDGVVTFAGARIDRLAPHERARRGLARTFQSIELFEDLTVRENLLAAVEPSRWTDVFADAVGKKRGRVRDADVDWALGVVGLHHAGERLPSELSHGQRKLVGAARALVVRPALVLLDEPAAGLDTTESQAFGVQLRRLVDEGVSILLIDHDMSLVLGVCDRIYVLDFGKVIAVGTPAQIRRNEAVLGAYLGRSGQAS